MCFPLLLWCRSRQSKRSGDMLSVTRAWKLYRAACIPQRHCLIAPTRTHRPRPRAIASAAFDMDSITYLWVFGGQLGLACLRATRFTHEFTKVVQRAGSLHPQTPKALHPIVLDAGPACRACGAACGSGDRHDHTALTGSLTPELCACTLYLYPTRAACTLLLCVQQEPGRCHRCR